MSAERPAHRRHNECGRYRKTPSDREGSRSRRKQRIGGKENPDQLTGWALTDSTHSLSGRKKRERVKAGEARGVRRKEEGLKRVQVVSEPEMNIWRGFDLSRLPRRSRFLVIQGGRRDVIFPKTKEKKKKI